MPSAIPCSLSPLISCNHSSLFSDWRRTVSSKFCGTQVPLVSTEELVLPRHAHCMLPLLRSTDTAYCLALILLGWAESKIHHAAPADIRPTTLLISFCTVQLRTLCAACSLAILSLFTTTGPGTKEFPGFRGSMVFRHVLEGFG